MGRVTLGATMGLINTMRPRQNGRHFTDDILNVLSWMKMHEIHLRFHWSLLPKFELKIFQIGSDNGLAPTRRQAIIWANEFISLMHICVTRSQWVNPLMRCHVKLQRKHQSSIKWPFVTEIHWWIPLTKGQWCGKRFPVMTSSRLLCSM